MSSTQVSQNVMVAPPSAQDPPIVDAFDENEKRTRGISKNLKFQNLLPGVKLPLDWDNYHCPIGENASAFATQCRIIVRLPENCPMQRTSFLDIEKDRRLRLINVIMERFNFERTKTRDQCILSSLGKTYNDYRTAFRKDHFRKHRTTAARLADRPSDVSPEDWKWLVKFWTTDHKFQKRSKQNMANSACLKLHHFSGSRSYAKHRENWNKKYENEPSRFGDL